MKSFIQSAGATLFTLGVVGLAGCQSQVAPVEDQRPNILLILLDDTSDPMLSYSGGGKQVLTPNIDRLAERGMRLNECYVASTVCVPSRYNFLTGQYAGRCEGDYFQRSFPKDVPYAIKFNTQMPVGQWTLGSVLQNAGYTTAYVGKWHTGADPEEHPIFNNRFKPDDLFSPGSKLADPETVRKLDAEYTRIQGVIGACGFDVVEGINWINTDDRTVESMRFHNLDWQAKGAIDFIDKYSKKRDKPFFMHLSLSAIHGPNHVDSIQSDIRITQKGLVDGLEGYLPPRQSIIDRINADPNVELNHRVAGALWSDDLIGAVIDKLEAEGLLENTLVILTSDHGAHPGKRTVYEDGVRVPGILCWPRTLAPGSSSDAFVQSIDLLPTVAALAGAELLTGPVIDGENRWPQIMGGPDGRDDLYFEYGHARSVKTKKWKYIATRYPEPVLSRMQNGQVKQAFNITGNQSGAYFQIKAHPAYFDQDQLYDLEADPNEQNNLTNDPQYAEVLAEMKARLNVYLDRFDHPYDLTPQPYLETPEYRALTEKSAGDDSIKQNDWYKKGAY